MAKLDAANKARTERRKAVDRAREAAIAASGLTPLEYMLQLLRDPKASVARRSWAAEKAAPYVHPKLATVELKGQVELGFAEKLVKARERVRGS